MPIKPGSARIVSHVNNHLTPLAVIIVAPAFVVAQLPRPVAIATAVLLVYSVTMNYLSVRLLRLHLGMVRSLRVASNYAVNICLLMMLYNYWPLAWLLFLLMSIGIAVYQSPRDSTLISSSFAVILLGVHWAYGGDSAMGWATVVVLAATIVIFNRFVNGLMRLPSSPA
ncbi:MAG: hypothetical protein HY748_15335 [Elusimicrobia bacterium]|nr:hypothetical protein [Elusimicrobiota bacterium]